MCDDFQLTRPNYVISLFQNIFRGVCEVFRLQFCPNRDRKYMIKNWRYFFDQISAYCMLYLTISNHWRRLIRNLVRNCWILDLWPISFSLQVTRCDELWITISMFSRFWIKTRCHVGTRYHDANQVGRWVGHCLWSMLYCQNDIWLFVATLTVYIKLSPKVKRYNII